jgi:fibronectin type 3 domain-containing protein
MVLLFSASSFAGDKATIKKNVNSIVDGINKGKIASSFKAGDYDPYAFIMKKDGVLVVHPSLTGSSLKEKAPPVYDALVKSTTKGLWVDYVWKGKQKHSYVKTSKNGLIVGSGYSE